MKQNTKRMFLILLIVSIFAIYIGVSVQTIPTVTIRHIHTRSFNDCMNEPVSIAAQVGRIINDTSAKVTMIDLRATNRSILRGQLRILIEVLNLINKLSALFCIFYFMVLFLNISGFYSKSMEILIYLHQKDGKKKDLLSSNHLIY